MTQEEHQDHIDELIDQVQVAMSNGRDSEAMRLLEFILVTIETYDLPLPITKYEASETLKALRTTQ
jgi:hypothetical protein